MKTVSSEQARRLWALVKAFEAHEQPKEPASTDAEAMKWHGVALGKWHSAQTLALDLRAILGDEPDGLA